MSFEPTYHGYGIQNFLDIDPHFGTREELRDVVDEAHAQGIYCILDVIVNHCGNVFEYKDARYTHLLSGTPAFEEAVEERASTRPSSSARAAEGERVARLEAEIERLSGEVAELRRQLEEFRKQFE